MRYIRKVSPLFFLLIFLILFPHQVYAPLVGDSKLGYSITDDKPTLGDSSHNAGNNNPGQMQVWSFWFKNKVEDANIVGYSSAWGNNANGCPSNAGNQVAFATFPTGFTPTTSGFTLSSGQTYTIQAIFNNNVNCNSSVGGGGFTGTETGTGTGPLVRLNQWVAVVVTVRDTVIVGGPQCANAAPGGSSDTAFLDGVTTGNTPLVVGQTETSGDNGFVISNCSSGGGGTWIFGLDLQATGSIAGSNQCLGNCATVSNSNTTSTINFNVSQTIFYLQQATLQNAQVANVSTVVGKTYASTFGMTLFLGLYSTQGQCPTPLDAPFSPRCPGLLIHQQAFPNPQKGVIAMSESLNLVGGQWIGVAFSASRSGLVLNDTSASISSKLVQGTMPSIITSFTDNGPIKTNLKAFILSTTSGPFPPPVCNINNDLACFEFQSVCALSPSNCMFGGVIYLIVYMAIWFFGTGYTLGWIKTNNEVELSIPPTIHILVFLSILSAFTVIGIFPLYLIVFEFLAVSVLFATTVVGLSRGGERQG